MAPDCPAQPAQPAMALALALIRRGVRGLHLITLPTCAYPASGMMADLLIGAGCVASVETSGISLHELGPAPRFTQAVREGRLRVRDSTCPAVYAALQAGAKGQPFAPLRGLIGSDLLRHRDDWRVIANPFASERLFPAWRRLAGQPADWMSAVSLLRGIPTQRQLPLSDFVPSFAAWLDAQRRRDVARVA